MKVTVVLMKGYGKSECEDAVLVGNELLHEGIKQFDFAEPTCICIADGVGGNNGGEKASQFILDRIMQSKYVGLNIEEVRTMILKINSELINHGSKTNNMKNMATTLTAVFINSDTSLYAHCGNTRLYVMQGSYLKQITKDQTTAQWLRDAGCHDAADLCNKNEIVGCLGGGDTKYATKLLVDEISNKNTQGTLIFTSDGIHEYVEIEVMEEVFRSEKDDMKAANLIASIASKAGSLDDKTIVIVRSRLIGL